MDEQNKAPDLSEDAFPENFPTSAKPIFRAIVILAATIALLCFIVYRCSEHPQEAAEQKKVEKKQAATDVLLSDEDEEETGESQ